jgi:predicted P-loop ATPase
MQCAEPRRAAHQGRRRVAVRPRAAVLAIKIGTIDIDALQHDRDQLFAEAYALFQAGVQWWPYQGFERRHIVPQQSDRYEGDPWEEQIRSYLNTLLEPQTTVTEIARAIGIDAPEVGKAEPNRITATMQDLGWKRGKRNGPKGTRWWVRG